MHCPYCSSLEDKVVDSRLSKEGEVIRRRRECLQCQQRYTTYERIEESLPMLIKKDGRRQPFDRKNIFSGHKKAGEKRPVSVDRLEAMVNRIEKDIQEQGVNEIESRMVGESVMRQLHALDQVAYVRFASVYREFKDVNQFMSELKSLLNESGQGENAE
ncbi:MAG: transcriptional regulator NrdR [Nitrospiria bacterium]